MIAFEIEINGKKYCLAGIEDWDLLSTTMMARRSQNENEIDEFELNVRCLAQQKVENQYEHVRWGRQELSIGDEIIIRIVEVSAADEPIKRYRSDKDVQENPFTEEEIYEMQKKTYIELKKKFEEDGTG